MVAVVNRRAWGAAFSIPGNRHVAPSTRRWFVVHWPGGNVGRDARAQVRSIERFHRQGRGWPAAPGYNFLVSRDGVIFEGCGRDVRGVHSPPRNRDGWGVCVLLSPGEAVPPAVRNATRALYEHLCGVAGRRLGMSWHGQHHPTSCPGPALTAWVRQGMPASGAATRPPTLESAPPTTPTPTPTPTPTQEDDEMPWIFTSSGRQSFLVANNRRYPLTAQLFREYEADRVPVRNVSAPTWLRWQAIYPAAKHP